MSQGLVHFRCSMSRDLAVQRKIQFDDGNMEDRRYLFILSSVPIMMKGEAAAKAEALKALKHVSILPSIFFSWKYAYRLASQSSSQ